MWPNSVWEMGETSKDGKQLWFHRAVTPMDVKRRKEYERKYHERQTQRLAA